jgi:hypothetical protein
MHGGAAMTSTDALYEAIGRLDPLRIELLQRLAERRGIPIEQLIIMPQQRDGRDYPLSSEQARIFFLESLDGPHAALTVSAIAKLEHAIDLDLLHLAMDAVARRHEVFKLQFMLRKGEPVQVLGSTTRMSWRHQIVTGSHREIQDMIDAEIAPPLSMREGPLLRILVLSMPDGATQVIISMHHLVSDGWSVRLFMREVGHVYESLKLQQAPQLPPLPVGYLDYVLHERSNVSQSRVQACIEQVKKLAPKGLKRLNMKADTRKEQVGLRSGTILSFVEPDVAWTEIIKLSQRHQVSLFTWLFHAWRASLDVHDWARAVPIAVPVTKRHRPEFERIIGYMSNLVLVFSAEDRALSPHMALQQTDHAIRSAFANQDVPFDAIIRTLAPRREDLGRSMYDLMFEYLDFRAAGVDPLSASRQNPDMSRASLVSQRSEFSIDTRTAKCPLFLAVWEEENQLAGAIEFDSALFDRHAVNVLKTDFIHRLRSTLLAAH